MGGVKVDRKSKPLNHGLKKINPFFVRACQT